MSTPVPAARVVGTWVAVLAGALFVVVAAVWVPWDWFPGGAIRPVDAASVFSADQIATAERVSSLFRWTGRLALLVSLAAVVVIGFSRRGPTLVRRIRGGVLVQVVVAALAVTLVQLVLTLPFAAYAHAGAVREGLSTQGWAAWSRDVVVGQGIDVLMTALPVLVLVLLARRLPRSWPAWGALGAGVLVVLGSFVYPIVVEPLFNHFTSLPDGPLRTEILAIADREGVSVQDVLVADASRRTTTLNAYVSGLGSTRRVVLYDTAVDSLSRGEMEAIVAHELAHVRHHDVLLGTTLGALGAASAVGVLAVVLGSGGVVRRTGVGGAGDPGVVPLALALIAIGGVLALPVQNTISRAMEARADLTALETTDDPGSFIALQKELAVRADADPTPPAWSQFWFGSHPTVLQRIGMAEAFARTRLGIAESSRTKGQETTGRSASAERGPSSHGRLPSEATAQR